MKFKLKINFHVPRFKEIQKIWNLEVIIAFIALALFLGWDAWIYFKLVDASGNFSATPDQSKVVTLKKRELEEISKKIDKYEEFLSNPNFTF